MGRFVLENRGQARSLRRIGRSRHRIEAFDQDVRTALGVGAAILSRMGWIRVLKGHQPLDAEVKFRDGDGPLMALHAETTDKLMVFGQNGRFYTLSANSLPGGRGMGEPLRLMVDLPNDSAVVDLFVWRDDESHLVASTAGDAPQLIVARVVQGLGGACVLPATLSS